jgi:hypothetical protein
MWIDNVQVADLQNLDNSISTVDFVRMGALSVKTGASGEMYFDDFASFRDLAPPRAQLVINEVDYDQVGPDSGGFVELHNAGASEAVLDGLTLAYVNGGDGLEYGNRALTGTLAPGAYLVIEVELQNGAPDGVAIVDTAQSRLVDALSYEGEIRTAQIGGATYDRRGLAQPAPERSGHGQRERRLGVQHDADPRNGEPGVIRRPARGRYAGVRGQGLRLASGGAAEDARRLGRRLHALRLRATLLRGVGGGTARILP